MNISCILLDVFHCAVFS